MIFNMQTTTTKTEALKLANAYAQTVPGAQLEKHAYSISVYTRSRTKLLVSFRRGTKARGESTEDWYRVGGAR